MENISEEEAIQHGMAMMDISDGRYGEFPPRLVVEIREGKWGKLTPQSLFEMMDGGKNYNSLITEYEYKGSPDDNDGLIWDYETV